MLNEIKEKFIEQTKENSKSNYSRKIGVFIKYLEEECGVNDKNYKEILTSIGIDKITDSVTYYVHNYGIKYSATTENYVTAIKSFFGFISKKYSICNTTFDSSVETSRLDEALKRRYDELELNSTEMKEPISDEEFNELLRACDNVIDLYEVGYYSIDKSRHRTKTAEFLSAIMMKLVMFTGIKNIVMPTIQKSDYDYELNKIKINGTWINLPDKLAYDFKKYYKVREEIINISNIKDRGNKKLFVKHNGEFLDDKNNSSTIYKVMKKVLKTTEGEALCKYVIMNHIETRMDMMEIINLTGHSVDTCMHCKEQLDIKLDKTRDKYISSKLRGSKLYEVL